MNDPYQVLGVTRQSSEDDIKKAYRRLSRTYHPDANIGKSEAERARAEEKFKEIQAAYKSIMDGTARTTYSYRSNDSGYQGANRGNPYGGFGGFGGFGNAYGNQRRTSSYGADEQDLNYFRAVENFLRNRMYAEAMRALGDIRNRNSRWFYYAAIASAGMGNMSESQSYIERAILMEPNNLEYRNFKMRMGDTPGRYTEVGRSYGAPDFQNNNVCCYVCLASVMCGGGCGYAPLFCCL